MQTGTVVGVVPTLQSLDAGVPDGPALYVPLEDEELTGATFVVRSTARPTLERLIETVTRGGDATAAPASIADRVIARTYPARIASAITIVIGVLTLLVAAAGVYGTVAHSVVSRIYEIGVHVALGAPRTRILRLVLGSSMRAIGSGATVASVLLLLGAVFASDALDPLFFGIRPLDPVAVGIGFCVLAGIMGVAAYLPARRALGAEPIEALRHT